MRVLVLVSVCMPGRETSYPCSVGVGRSNAYFLVDSLNKITDLFTHLSNHPLSRFTFEVDGELSRQRISMNPPKNTR